MKGKTKDRVKDKGGSHGPEVREEILKIARKHFAAYGLQGANLSSIAKESGVANSLINYYFSNKSGLFTACIEEFVSQRQGMIEKILSEPRSVDELKVRIQLFIDDMMESCLNDAGLHDIIFNELRSGNKLIEKVFRETLMVVFDRVVDFFSLAQKNGVVKEDLNPRILAQILFNFISETCRKDYLSERFFHQTLKDPEFRAVFINNILSVFLNGAIA